MFDQEQILPQIVDRLAQGEPLEQICRTMPGAPATRTIRDWIEKNVSISADIARAREQGHDAIAWRARDVARGKTDAGSSGDVARDKLIVETDLKLLAKWDKRYGDQLNVKHSGGVTFAVNVIAPTMATLAPKPALEHDADSGE